MRGCWVTVALFGVELSEGLGVGTGAIGELILLLPVLLVKLLFGLLDLRNRMPTPSVLIVGSSVVYSRLGSSSSYDSNRRKKIHK
jgi:hypothetical protein